MGLTDLDKLEALAWGATSGPWTAMTPDGSNMDFVVAEASDIASVVRSANARYIAAVNPTAILNLVDELRKAKAERDWLAARIYHDGYLSCPGGKVQECQKVSCKNCWLEAAHNAVEGKQ